MKRLGRILWLVQAVSGGLLVLLAGLHWVVQHYIASGGLRDYAAVVGYLSHPLAFSVEVIFLAVVTAHALLGVRAILLDLGPGPRTTRVLNATLLAAGLLTLGYGVCLLVAIIS